MFNLTKMLNFFRNIQNMNFQQYLTLVIVVTIVYVAFTVAHSILFVALILLWVGLVAWAFRKTMSG